MLLSRRLAVECAPFFVVNDSQGETVYVSVLRLIRDRFDPKVTAIEEARAIDADDIGGI
jgi:hypothetical protein